MFKKSINLILLSSIIMISGCSEAGGSEAEDHSTLISEAEDHSTLISEAEDHSTLILEGTIEYIFNYGGDPYTWTPTFSHTDGNKYVLECKSDDVVIATDNDNDGNIYISITNPPSSSLSSATEYPLVNSSNPDAEILSADMEIMNGSDVDVGDIQEGDYSELVTDADMNKAKSYMFMYSTEETTLDGTVDFGNGGTTADLTYDNVKLNKGWTKVIYTPVLGGAGILTNGTISNAVWFSIEN